MQCRLKYRVKLCGEKILEKTQLKTELNFRFFFPKPHQTGRIWTICCFFTELKRFSYAAPEGIPKNPNSQRLHKLKATREKIQNYTEEKQYNLTEEEFQYYNFQCMLRIPLYIMFQWNIGWTRLHLSVAVAGQITVMSWGSRTECTPYRLHWYHVMVNDLCLHIYKEYSSIYRVRD